MMHSRDTSREASEVQGALHRDLGPAGRVELAFELSELARELSISGMMDRDPSLSRSQARARLIRRILGSDLYDAAFSHPRA